MKVFKEWSLTEKQVLMRTKLDKESLYSLISRGLFPEPIKHGSREIWESWQVKCWIAAKTPIDKIYPEILISNARQWVPYESEAEKLRGEVNRLQSVIHKLLTVSATNAPTQLQGVGPDLRELFHLDMYPTCVYFLVHKDEIVYVGQSTSLTSRIKAHQNEKLFDRVMYIPVLPRNLSRTEEIFIHRYRPKYNRELRHPWGHGKMWGLCHG